MTPLPPELEALMPKPWAYVSDDHNGALLVSRHEWSETHQLLHSTAPVYSHAQVRQAILDATERAAKLAAGLATDAAIKYAGGYPVDFDDVAAAIRGGGQG